MGTQRTTFAKLQRDRAKAAKRAAKLAAKQGKPIPGTTVATPPETEAEPVMVDHEDLTKVEALFVGRESLGPSELMSLVEDVQRMHGRGELTDDELEEAKLEIMERLG